MKRVSVWLAASIWAVSAGAQGVNGGNGAPVLQSAGTLFSQGVTAERNGNYEAAGSSYQQVIKAYPDSPQALEANRRLFVIDERAHAAREAELDRIMAPGCALARKKALDAGITPSFKCQ